VLLGAQRLRLQLRHCRQRHRLPPALLLLLLLLLLLPALVLPWRAGPQLRCCAWPQHARTPVM
jgi:hypothetical protein